MLCGAAHVAAAHCRVSVPLGKGLAAARGRKVTEAEALSGDAPSATALYTRTVMVCQTPLATEPAGMVHTPAVLLWSPCADEVKQGVG